MADRACVALIANSHVLLVRQTYRGQLVWTFPGGGIEADESPAAAAVREVYEETGLTVEIIRPVCQTDRTTGTGTYYCFLGRILSGTARLGQDPELPLDAQDLQEVRWFPLHEVRDHVEVAQIWDHLVGTAGT